MNFKLLAIIASLIASLTAGGVALTQTPAKPTSESAASSAASTSSYTAVEPRFTAIFLQSQQQHWCICQYQLWYFSKTIQLSYIF